MATFPAEVPFETRVSLVESSLLPSELTVAKFLRSRPEVVVELKAQDLAEAIGVARSTVIRTCQTLGYSGYTQLRVTLARELVPRESTGTQQAESSEASTALTFLRTRLAEVSRAAQAAGSALTEDLLTGVVQQLLSARRIVCAANGFSTAVAMDFSMRLAAMGLPAEFVGDYVAQQFTVAHLTEADVCFVVSASGQNEATLRVAEVAEQAGAHIIALCSFPRSPLAQLAEHTIIAVPSESSFRDELDRTSRIAHVSVAEALVSLVLHELGDEEVETRRSRLIPVIGSNLVD